jgi:hypothetical protein
MAISGAPAWRHHVPMTSTTATAPGASRAGGLRHLSVVGANGQRPLNRDDALRRVRSVQRHVLARQERFAHLKRVYD